MTSSQRIVGRLMDVAKKVEEGGTGGSHLFVVVVRRMLLRNSRFSPSHFKVHEYLHFEFDAVEHRYGQ